MQTGTKVALLILSATALLVAGPYDDWGKYRTVTVNTTNSGGGANVGTAQANFPLLVRLSDASAASGANVLSEALAGGTDVRFTTGDGQVAIPYEIERWSASAAEIWVLVPSVTGNANTAIRMYWGKPGAASESNGAAVFSTQNGYEAVFHMNEASGDTIRDVTANGYMGIPVVGTTAGSTAPSDTAGPIGRAKAFGGNIATTAAGAQTGGAYRLETATGGNTFNSFDYVGNDAEFTISVWVNFDAYPGGFTYRRGIITKADHGANQIDNNDPLTQWFLRPNIAARVLHFQRHAEANYPTTPYSIVDGTGPVAGVLNNWNYVSFAAMGATTNGNLFRLYNAEGSTFRSINDENGVHRDVDVFIGGFASNSGPGGAKSNGTHFLNGMIDEVRIQNVARSAQWTNLEYATQRPGQTAVTLGATVDVTPRPVFYRLKHASYLINQAIEANAPVLDASLGAPTGFTIAPTGLPAGLAFSTSTGIISGTPTAATAVQQYIVTANFSGASGTDTLTIAVTAGDPPGAPTGVSATAASGAATVTWSAPASSGTTAISGYTVRAVQDTSKTCAWTNGPLSCTVTGLANGTAYTFTVVATNTIGNSAPSAPSTAVTPAGPPGAPTNVSVSLLSGAGATATATISWTAPADDGGMPITGTFAFGSPSGNCFAAGATGSSCNVSGLAYGTAYTFRVAAANQLGMGDTSVATEPFTPTALLPGSFTIRTSGATPFAFTLTDAALASTEAFTLTIHDIWGRAVWSKTAHPARDEIREIVWSGRTTSGREVAAGIYLVRVTTHSGGAATDFVRRAELRR